MVGRQEIKSQYCTKTGKTCYGETELPLLFEISRMINNSRFIKDVLPPIMELIAKYLGAERSLLSVLNRESSNILIEAAYGISPEAKKQGRYLIGEGVTGEVVKTGKPVFINKISKTPGFVNKTGISLKTSDQEDISFICVPIKVDEEIVGTLSIARVYKEGSDAQEMIRLLMVVGSMIAQAVRARQDRLEEIERLKEQNEKLQIELHNQFNDENIVGNSSKIKEVFILLQQVAKTQATVLIRGESGVGKERIADAIHYNSTRAKKPFVKVNCSALPESLIESELFGHEKGAFTGADSMKKGRFEMAEGGTVFLDEIGDLPKQIQVKLLRVIQERQFERLGSTKTINCDVRLLAATNRKLEEAIETGDFREDLYYRINVFPVYVPPLRDRLSDVPQLVDHFIQKSNIKNGTQIKRISSSAIEMLMIYQWPGNIRELENCIERAAILSTDGVIRSQHLPPTLQTAQSTGTMNNGTLQVIVDKVEKQLIIDSLTSARGNVLQSAKELGITNRKLGLRIEKYGIDVNKFKALGKGLGG
ncbi:MAG: sigma 54-interacting transcriptional regulator [Bacteroidales bacterium]|nr:sigma 54-interacting transcriptional regulator [Bacteroidales bacterium]